MLEQLITAGATGYVFEPPAVVPGTPYKGFVTSTSFVKGDDLAALVGLTEGTPFNVDAGWLHYIDGEHEFYIARLPVRYGMSGASLTAAAQVAGKSVTIAGKEYKVRMMTGMSQNPFSSIISVPSGGEWDKYMYPIYGGADRPAGVQWSYYTNRDLGLVEGAAQLGTISLCADLHSTIANAYAGRGRDYSGGQSIAVIQRKTVINDANAAEGNGGFGRNAYGWRPILDYVPPPPTIADTWEDQGVMPVQRRSASAVAIDGKVYIYGGYDQNTTTQGQLHVFDPATKVFTALVSGSPRASHDAVAIDGKMYAFGGVNGATYLNDIVMYDPVLNSWSTLPTGSAAARSRHKLIVDGNGFIAVGGLTTGGGNNTTFQRYDLGTKTWGTAYGSYGNQLYGLADAFGTLYATGGYPGSPSALNTAIVTATAVQTARQAVPSTRYGHVSFYIKQGVYVIGGVAGVAADQTKVMRYVPSSNTWVTLGTIPWAMADNSAYARVGDDIYIFGGSGGTNFTACWKYTP
jgi:N-acetylneuraminic acid mutarotase